MPRALITDLSDLYLTSEEQEFLEEYDPFGLILFSRNIEHPHQVRELVDSFRTAVGRADAPVMIDQEGGRVVRLREPHWWSGVPAGKLGKAGPRTVQLASRLIAEDLYPLGVNMVCAPCLDLRLPGMDDVIGDRAFGADPMAVTDCGKASCAGFLAGGIMPIIKHLPGHGRVRVDPHHVLPEADCSLELMQNSDFLPFKSFADAAWGIVAHVVFHAIDPERPASQSPSVINDVIRGEIGFSGILLTDALDMAALSGSHPDRARACLEAGCDIIIHCNQDLATRIAVAEAVPVMDSATLQRIDEANRILQPEAPFDRVAARRELDQLLCDGDS